VGTRLAVGLAVDIVIEHGDTSGLLGKVRLVRNVTEGCIGVDIIEICI
jgi:hypothetical protein